MLPFMYHLKNECVHDDFENGVQLVEALIDWGLDRGLGPWGLIKALLMRGPGLLGPWRHWPWWSTGALVGAWGPWGPWLGLD